MPLVVGDKSEPIVGSGPGLVRHLIDLRLDSNGNPLEKERPDLNQDGLQIRYGVHYPGPPPFYSIGANECAATTITFPSDVRACVLKIDRNPVAPRGEALVYCLSATTVGGAETKSNRQRSNNLSISGEALSELRIWTTGECRNARLTMVEFYTAAATTTTTSLSARECKASSVEEWSSQDVHSWLQSLKMVVDEKKLDGLKAVNGSLLKFIVTTTHHLTRPSS